MNARRLQLALVAAVTAGLMAASVATAKRQATAAYRLSSAAATDKAKAALQEAADDHVDALTTLSRKLEAVPPINREEYGDLAVRAAAAAPAFAAVNYLDHRFIEKYLYPYSATRALEGLDLKTRADALPAAHRAVETRRPAATDLVPLAQGGEGFLAYAPVRRKDRWEGLVEGVLASDDFGRRFVAPAAPKRHDVTLLSETSDRPFFTTRRDAAAGFGPYDFYLTVNFADRRWWAVLHPVSSPSPLVPLTVTMLLELGLGAWVARRILRR